MLGLLMFALLFEIVQLSSVRNEWRNIGEVEILNDSGDMGATATWHS